MGETFFWGKRKCHWRRESRTASNKQNWRKHWKNSSNCMWKSLAVRSIAEQVNIDRETVRKINWRSSHEEGVHKNGPKEAHWRTKAKNSHNLPRPFGEARWHFGPCHHRWWNMGLPIWPWNKVAKCTMEDCKFPTSKKIRQSKSRVKTMLLTFFDIRRICHYEFLPTGQTLNQV